jgi:peptidoglycan/xylan/chitin deacetylase (PgdA/CDA1 family)
MLATHLRARARSIRNLAGNALRSVRVSCWMASHHDFLAIFYWHQVSPSFDPQFHHRYTWKSLDSFATVIDYLVARFRIVPLYEAMERLKTGDLRGRCVALTFDDGDISVADYVVPFLRQRNLPATFFINTAYLEGQTTYWFPVLSYARPALPDVLREKALMLRDTEDPHYYDQVRKQVEQLAPLVPNLDSRLVSPEWLSSLDGEQFAIGAHGHEHQRFSMMAKEWQRESLLQNVRTLSQFSAFKPLFAVPFGTSRDWTATTLAVARELGLDVLLADGGINLAPASCFRRQGADSLLVPELILRAIQRS